MEYTAPHSYWRDGALLLIATLLLFCIGLGAHAYLVPSEARYIELPRQMLATGDFLTPRLNGVPYFEKPPLFYWMQAGMMGLFGNPTGDNEFVGRIATALLLSLTCALTYAMGRMMFGRLAGWLAAVVLASCLMGYGLSRVAMLDVPVTFFITATIGCFLAAQKDDRMTGLPDDQKKSWLSGHLVIRSSPLYLIMYAAAALAMLTKGLIAIVIPGMVIGVWIIATRQWQILREMRLIPGMIIFAAIAAPWHILMARVHPDFLHFYFIHEHFERFLTDEAKRGKPWWFFTAVTLVGLLPWTGLLPASLRQLTSRKPTDVFLFLWIVLPFVFFSTSHSQLLPYIFPIFPPVAMLFGKTLADAWNETSLPRSLRHTGWLALIFFGIAIVFFLALPYIATKSEHKFPLPSSAPLEFLTPVCAIWLVLAFALFVKRTPRTLIVALAVSGIGGGLVTNYMAARYDNASVKPMATALKDRLQKGDKVVSYDTYFQDLPIYLGRNVIVTGWRGELEFGITHYPQTQGWMIRNEEFLKLCEESPRLYVFVKRDIFEDKGLPAGCPLKEIDSYGRNVLLEKE